QDGRHAREATRNGATAAGTGASGVLRDRGGRGPDVTAAELDRVHDEGCDLVQGHSTFPSELQRVRLAVRGETFTREPTEEPHHCEVELAVASVGCRIDQPAAPFDIDQPVARPEVTVQPRRRLAGVERGEPIRETF